MSNRNISVSETLMFKLRTSHEQKLNYLQNISSQLLKQLEQVNMEIAEIKKDLQELSMARPIIKNTEE